MNAKAWRPGALFIACLMALAALQTPLEVFAARVPFRVVRGVVVFEARIDGRGPFDFTFDPGANDVLTNIAAVSLGLKSTSQTRVRSLRIGDAEIRDIPLPVYVGNPADIFQTLPNEPPIAGALGPGILNRFAVRLDYRAHTLTLTPLKTFVYAGRGIPVPFTMQDDNIPLIAASVDGVTGIFQYDVRAPAALFLFSPFLERSGLAQRYSAGSHAVAALTVAGKTLANVPTRFGPARSGTFGSANEAGLLGYGVLSRFTTTIDYSRKVIYFEP